MADTPTLPDFTAVDVELANAKFGSVCSIALAKVRHGQIVDARHRLCVPAPPLNFFGRRQMQLHGIGPVDLRGALPFAEAYRRMCRFVGDDPLVAHGTNDRAMLGQSCECSGVSMADHDFIDTVAISRAVLPDLADHKLPTLAAHLGVELVTHHNALADARACAEIFLALGSPDRRVRRSYRYGGGGPPSVYGTDLRTAA